MSMCMSMCTIFYILYLIFIKQSYILVNIIISAIYICIYRLQQQSFLLKNIEMQTLSQDNFKVLIRVRPLNSKQKQQISTYEQTHSKKIKGSSSLSNNKMIKMTPSIYSFYTKFYNCNIDQIIKIHKKNNTICVADQQYKNTDRKMKPYIYSGVYDVHDKNKYIFNKDLKDHVADVLQGYNCTILAYGITGSGKTYTVFGPNNKKYINNNNNNINNMNSNNNSNFNTFNANSNNSSSFSTTPNLPSNQYVQQQIQGISFLTFEFLLKQKQRLFLQQSTKITYKLSFVQIYNENVRDLLTVQKQKQNKFLNIVQDYKGNTTISEVTQISIQTIQQIYYYINMGNTKRAFASTFANQYSSRSHAILQLMVQTEKINLQKTYSKLYIIDLAGSQKLQSLNCSKKMQQGANINRSLLALGNCINTLAQNSRKNTISHIPYRDSKLTRMLKDSLGGNTKTIMIACISSNPFLIDQTMTTLNYAMRAQGIKKKINKNQLEYDSNPNNNKDRQEYLCLKCKRSSKLDQQQLHQLQQIRLKQQQQKQKQQKGLLRQRSSSLTNLPLSIQSTYRNNNSNNSTNNNNKQKLKHKIDMLQCLYQDIINNIKQSESIKTFANSHIANDPQWLKIKCINQQQRIRLKQVLFQTFKLSNQNYNNSNNNDKQDRYFGNNSRQLQNSSTSKNSKMHTQEYQGKENQQSGRDSNKSLSGSKSRRKRSHNKFQVFKKSDSFCKTIEFQ